MMMEAAKNATVSVGEGAATLAESATSEGVSFAREILETLFIAAIIILVLLLGAIYGRKYANNVKAEQTEEQRVNDAIGKFDLNTIEFIIGVNDPSTPTGPPELLYVDKDSPRPVSEEDSIAAFGTDGLDVPDPTFLSENGIIDVSEAMEEVAHRESTTPEDGDKKENEPLTMERSQTKLPLGTPTFPTLSPAIDSANPTTSPVEGTESPTSSLNSGTTIPSGASVTESLASPPTDTSQSSTAGSPVQESRSPSGSCLDSAGYEYTMSYEYDADSAEYIYSYTVNDDKRNLKNALSHWNIHFGMYYS